MDMEKLLRIPIAELALLRITCPQCGTASELPMEQVAKRIRGTDCPFCDVQLFAQGRTTAAANFALAVGDLLREQGHVRVEIVVPAQE